MKYLRTCLSKGAREICSRQSSVMPMPAAIIKIFIKFPIEMSKFTVFLLYLLPNAYFYT